MTEQKYQENIETLYKCIADLGLIIKNYRKANHSKTTVIKKLRERELKLHCLEECGVDNWSGYGEAMELLEQYQNQT